MKRTVQRAALSAVAVVALAAPAAGAAAASSCKSATIGGKHVCLRKGIACKQRYESRYEKAGYACARDAKGRYRLRVNKQSF